jgi:hypothetical protein
LAIDEHTSHSHEVTIGGHKFYRNMVGKDVILLGEIAGVTVTIQSPNRLGAIDVSVSGVLGTIGEGVIAALQGLVGLLKSMQCTQQTTLKQEFDGNGHLISQTFTTTCTPN